MPSNARLGLHNGYGVQHQRKQTIEPHEEQSVRYRQLRLRRNAPAGHGKNKTFHSIRRTVSTLLEAANVLENLSADIIGHDKDTMNYGLYSGRGTTRESLPAALAKLQYPKPL